MNCYALIIAGGSGTRLWPMSTFNRPKQLIPLIDGKSLLEIAVQRLRGLLDDGDIYICAGQSYKQDILDKLPFFNESNFISEPEGRDTLNAVALGTGVIARRDPEALVGIFTADHLIEPQINFQQAVDAGFTFAKQNQNTLVTFGVTPTYAATGFGYLKLGDKVGETNNHTARRVTQFKEKPDSATAQKYFAAGADQYQWNSGMFVFQARTMLDCVRRFASVNYNGLKLILDSWGTQKQTKILEQEYPQLKKISLDYAIMEPASCDDKVNIATLPMEVSWLDIGSWPALADTRKKDEADNVFTGCRSLFMETKNTLAVSDDENHLIATIGCQDMIVVHTKHATLICPKDQAQKIKQLHSALGQTFGKEVL